MRRILAPLCLLALVTACGGDDKASSPDDVSSATTAVSGTGSGATSVDAGADAAIDPAVTKGCDILTAEQMASIFGEAQDPYNPNLNRTDVTDCQWYASDGRSIGFQIDLLNEPSSVLTRRGQPVEVGNEAYVEGGNFPRFEADIHGWPVLAYGLEGAVTADDVVAVGRLLESVLVERSVSGGESSTDGGDSGSTDGGVAPLTAMSVTIDQPARIAGTMTLADLNAASSLAMCGGPWTQDSIGKMFTVVYEYGVMTDGATSPAPVVGLSLTAQGEYIGPGRYEAQMRFATSDGEVNGLGWMTVNLDELSGSFIYEDRSGDITGTWTCAAS